MQDAWRAYLELALGLTEASKKRAQTVARKLVGQSGATASQLQGLAEELITTGIANRQALTKIVRFEVDRALGVVGLATAEEVADLTARVRELERELHEAKAGVPSTTAAAASMAVLVPTAKKTVAKKAVVKKAAGAVTTQQVVKKAVAKKAVAKKTAVKSAGRTGGMRAKTGQTEPKRVEAKKLPLPAKKSARSGHSEATE